MLTAPNPSQVMFLLLVLGHLVVGVRAGYREFHDTPRGGNRWVGAFMVGVGSVALTLLATLCVWALVMAYLALGVRP